MSQATPDPTPPPVLKRCLQCGAHLQPTAARCWLCYADVADGAASGDAAHAAASVGVDGGVAGGPPFVRAEVVAPHKFSQLSEIFFQIVSAALALVLLLTAAGLFMEEPAAGVVFLFFVLLPLGMTFVRVHSQRQRHGAVSWAEKVGTFVVSTALLVGLAGVVIVAGMIALFVYCLFAMNSGGFH